MGIWASALLLLIMMIAMMMVSKLRVDALAKNDEDALEL